jgi:Ribbon-helix-helix protein, copG family
VKKTSIYLEDDLDQALALRAAEEGITKAELIRRSLRGVADRPRRVKPEAIGVVASGRVGVSADLDAYLEETGFGR